jgi:hypothetical protein
LLFSFALCNPARRLADGPFRPSRQTVPSGFRQILPHLAPLIAAKDREPAMLPVKSL